MPILDWIEVGQVSAERDPNLQHYFFDAGVSKAIVDDPTRFLLLGRKGAGKTAVFLHLCERPAGIFKKTDVVIPLTTDDYNWRAHQALADPNKTSGAQYRDSWRFLVAVESIRGITKHLGDAGRSVPKGITEAHKLLERLFGSPVPGIGEVLRDKIFSLSKLKLPSAGLDSSMEEMKVDGGEISFAAVEADPSLRSTLAFNLDHMTTYLESRIEQCLNGMRVFFIFDKIDEEWLPGADEKTKELIGGLLHAAEYVTRKFKSKLRPIVFLREDIFEALDTINDKNKLRMDCSQTLMWDKAKLEKLALSRLNYFAKIAKAPPITSFNQLFDSLPGYPALGSSIDYIFCRTFCRPRDIIAFLSQIIALARADKRDGEQVEAPDGRILDHLVADAEGAYSLYLYNEIIDEWKTQRPAVYKYLDILSNLESREFSIEAFQAEYRSVFKTAGQRDLIRDVLIFLYDVSIIGYKRSSGGKLIVRCFNEMRKYEDSEKYYVHEGLVSHLGLV